MTRLFAKLNTLLILGIAFFISSCSTIYIPNTQNVPLFIEKNEVAVTGALALGDQSSGGDIQGAYAITDHFAVVGNAYFGQVQEEGLSSHRTIWHNNFELGAGYFTKLGTSKGIFEVYGGWGIGGPRNTIDAVRKFYRNNHFWVQPNIGGRLGAIDLAFSTRINYLVWDEFSEAFLEPAFTLRLGGEKIKLQLQFLISAPIDGDFNAIPYNNNDSFTSHEVFHTSIGIFVPINQSK